MGLQQHTGTPAPSLLQLPQPQRALPETDNSYYVHKSGYAWRSDEGGDWDVDASPDNEHNNQTDADELTEAEQAAAQSFGSTTSKFYDAEKKSWQNV